MAAFDMSKATPAQRETIEEIHKDRRIPAGQAVSPLWASMIASAGAWQPLRGGPSPLDIAASPQLPLVSAS